MPSDAPWVKLENTRALGADVVLYDRGSESREAIARSISDTRGCIIVEILDQAKALGAEVNQVLVCCGGGGLVAGTAMAIRSALPEIRVYSVEPEAFDDTARSLRAGVRQHNDPGAASICDALLAPAPGELTFPINLRYLTGGLTVSDEEVRTAIGYAFRYLRLVIEPDGAVALAAALAGKLPLADQTTVLIVSGSNIDPVLFSDIVRQQAP
jgi:threonine dehydratase